MKKILLINPHREILIEIPLFGKMRWKKLPKRKLKGQKINILICDEMVNIK